MTAQEYWHGDPYLCKAYREKYKLEKDRLNQQLWLQGLYFYAALGSALSSAFGKSHSEAQKYPSKPFSLSDDKEYDQESKAAAEREKIIQNLKAHQAAMQIKFAKEKDDAQRRND